MAKDVSTTEQGSATATVEPQTQAPAPQVQEKLVPGFDPRTGNFNLADGIVAENVRGTLDLEKGIGNVLKIGQAESMDEYKDRLVKSIAALAKVRLSLESTDDGKSRYGITLAGVHSSLRGTVSGNEAVLEARSAPKKI